MSKDKIQPPEELIEKVRFIADTKEGLPFNYRGSLNVQGVYYQVRPLPGGSLFYMAGGKFIPNLTFRVELDGSVMVKKYKPGDWETSVDAAEEMAWKLFEETTPPEEELLRRAKEEEQKKRRQKVSYYEKRTRDEPRDSIAWSQLARLYMEEERYKDMENAIKKALEVEISPLDCKHLGMTYLAALSNSIRRKKIPILGYIPSSITADSLSYTPEETRGLARESLGKAYEICKKAGYFDEESLKELELAYKAAEECSDSAFEEYEKFKVKQQIKEDKEMEERLRALQAEAENDKNT